MTHDELENKKVVFYSKTEKGYAEVAIRNEDGSVTLSRRKVEGGGSALTMPKKVLDAFQSRTLEKVLEIIDRQTYMERGVNRDDGSPTPEHAIVYVDSLKEAISKEFRTKDK